MSTEFTFVDKFLVSKPTRSWREKDGVIYFSVISDGTTGKDWIKRLENKGFRVGDRIKQILYSSDFKPTSGVTTEVAVLKGILFEDNDRITKKIYAEANKRKLLSLNIESVCFIREKFMDKEVGAMCLWRIVAMYKPINDFICVPSFLSMHHNSDGCWFDAYNSRLNDKWLRGSGFAFAVCKSVSS